MLDVTFVVRGDERFVASSRYRVYQYLPYLREHNVRFAVIKPPARKLVHWYLWIPFVVRLIIFCSKSHTIFVQKDIFSVGIWSFFKRKGKRIIYDYDDAVYLENAVFLLPHLQQISRKNAVQEMVELSDLVVVANEHLAEFARAYNHNTLILPMSIDLAKYPVKAQHGRLPVVLGWIGSSQTTPFLQNIQDALAAIFTKYYPDVVLRIVSNGYVDLGDVEFEQVPWDETTEVANILSFDVGLVPMPGNPWTKGKSSFKLLQFMAAGLPTVSSAVGFNAQAIQEGENGFLAETTRQWVERLGQLIECLELRQTLGSAARKTVEKRYCLDKNTELFTKSVTQISEGCRNSV